MAAVRGDKLHHRFPPVLPSNSLKLSLKESQRRITEYQRAFVICDIVRVLTIHIDSYPLKFKTSRKQSHGICSVQTLVRSD